jgi:hypothetical protein
MRLRLATGAIGLAVILGILAALLVYAVGDGIRAANEAERRRSELVSIASSLPMPSGSLVVKETSEAKGGLALSKRVIRPPVMPIFAQLREYYTGVLTARGWLYKTEVVTNGFTIACFARDEYRAEIELADGSPTEYVLYLSWGYATCS